MDTCTGGLPNEVAENQIALCTRGQDHDAVRIPP